MNRRLLFAAALFAPVALVRAHEPEPQYTNAQLEAALRQAVTLLLQAGETIDRQKRQIEKLNIGSNCA